MTRWFLWPALFLIFPSARTLGVEPTTSRPAVPSFDTAREHVLAGEYDRAIEILDRLAKAPGMALEAACVRSEIDLQTGDYRRGLSRLGAVEKQAGRSVAWLTRRAALHEAIGEYDTAIRLNRRAISLNEESIHGHWQLGRLLETIGQCEEAIEAYEVLNDILTRKTLPEEADAETLTCLGLGFYRYSVLTGTNLANRTQLLLDFFTDDILHQTDPRYWPARFAAANLLAAYNPDEARSEYESILKANPKAADASVALGRSHLDEWNLEETERSGRAALKVNPNHVGAYCLLADLRLTERRHEEAATFAEQALAVNPKAIEALGALATARRLSGDTGAVADLLRRARGITSRPAVFHDALGRGLAATRRFDAAAVHFQKAIEQAPTWAAPLQSLGLLYMETGEEGRARSALESAFKLDSFNQRTFDILDLLDRLDTFDRIESAHFILKFDGTADGAIAPAVSEVLEGMYEAVCRRYGAELKNKTIVEIFPRHDGFSTRVHGRPFIATIGACSGRVIALAAPRGRRPFGWYNWASMLRHEFTHAVTLAATDNRIPHWLTEGLAVFEEPAPRSWDRKRLLSDAVRRDRLFSWNDIDWGFIRPRRPDGRALAYAQSEWRVEYLIQRGGEGIVKQMLAMFRNGRSQAEILRNLLKTDPERFDRDFRDWARHQVEAWGLPIVTVEDPETIRSELKMKPDDAGLLARLARAEWLDDRWDKAEAAAGRALKIDKNQPVALEIMARLWIGRMLLEEKETARRELIDRAEPYLRALHAQKPDLPIAIKYLGYVEQADSQWNEAIFLYGQYQRRFPEDPDTYRRLAAIHLRRKNEAAALEQLEALARGVDDDPFVARRLAAMRAERGEYREAVRWYRQALHIDPYRVETHGALGDAWFELGEYRRAEREYRVVIKMLPEEAIGYEGLARVFEALGNQAEAETYQKEAEALRGGARPQDMPPPRKFD